MCESFAWSAELVWKQNGNSDIMILEAYL